MAAAGENDGTYLLGGAEVTVVQGRAVLSGSDTLAGSTVTQDWALRHALFATGLLPVEAVAAATSTPARAIGRQGELGLLSPGYLADAVLLNEGWEVQQVWAGGVAQI
jgi:N-acetylglucosamine-6-phosphate deacetylase